MPRSIPLCSTTVVIHSLHCNKHFISCTAALSTVHLFQTTGHLLRHSSIDERISMCTTACQLNVPTSRTGDRIAGPSTKTSKDVFVMTVWCFAQDVSSLKLSAPQNSLLSIDMHHLLMILAAFAGRICPCSEGCRVRPQCCRLGYGELPPTGYMDI